MQAWVEGDETQIPGSETHRQAGDRFAAALHDLLEDLPPEGVMVVVAHGAVLRTGACAFLDIPEAHWGTFGGLGNCAWSVLEESRHKDWFQVAPHGVERRNAAGAGALGRRVTRFGHAWGQRLTLARPNTRAAAGHWRSW